MKNWTDSIKELLSDRYPNLTSMVVLRSEKGCKKQLAHCDYEQDITFARCPDSYVPLGCLVCIREGTTIDVWLKSIRLPCLDTELTDEIVPIPRTTIRLNPGQILVFRGDLFMLDLVMIRIIVVSMCLWIPIWFCDTLTEHTLCIWLIIS